MKIKSIRKTNPQTVYAIQTSTHTFIADNLAHHNCSRCNRWLHGNLGVYAIKLDEMYGAGTAAGLLAKKHEIRKLSRSDYEDLITEYTLKLEDLG